ncbi:MAG TPA: aminotransferase class I/II-fold pyridoxal phosphate-dependent enzyme [Thermoanaerobaculia bacterium]|nr:aminotransferase class I/II-fold pyridoxal phosphate-dependent enzyme [Thermoanaerobaculia bacterium]
MSRIYLSPPHLSSRERELLEDALASNWVAPVGPHVDAFERELAQVAGVAQAAALSSGTAGLHLALQLAGVTEGDVVLCPTLTFVASANTIVYCGAEPLFVDCDRSSWTIDPGLVEEALAELAAGGRSAKAVMAVDLYGQCADYDRLAAACDEHGAVLIQDAAEALGASYRGRPAGSLGRFGVFSFNGNKIITTSGGGALVSDDAEAVARARFLAGQAREKALHYEHREVGYNYRLSNLLAAVGRGQLAVLQERVAARRRNFDTYVELLADLPGVGFMPEAAYGTSNRWLTCVLVDRAVFGATPGEVCAALAAEDVEARPLWKPMHLQPLYSSSRPFGGTVAEGLFRDGLCLPSGSSLAPADLERIAAIVRRCRR